MGFRKGTPHIAGNSQRVTGSSWLVGVFMGDYASKGNGVNNSMAEAAHITGQEINADVVNMASYAPLLVTRGNTQWTSDMIFFNNGKSWTTPNYDVHKMFMINVGKRWHPVPRPPVSWSSNPSRARMACTPRSPVQRTTTSRSPALIAPPPMVDDFSNDAAP